MACVFLTSVLASSSNTLLAHIYEVNRLFVSFSDFLDQKTYDKILINKGVMINLLNAANAIINISMAVTFAINVRYKLDNITCEPLTVHKFSNSKLRLIPWLKLEIISQLEA